MDSLKIIQVHNYYQQAGGEDAVVAAERALLEEHGHAVVPFYKSNEALGSGLWALGKASLQTVWNWETYREFRRLLQTEKPDIVHCHNTFPLISPSIYWACAKEKVPVVQTLHNYRLLCLNAFLFREKHRAGSRGNGDELAAKKRKKKAYSNDLSQQAQSLKSSPSGAICELCVHKAFKWPGIRYRCYRESRAGSLIVALMLFVHKLIGTWSKKVSAYIALTEFQKQKMIEGGQPEDTIFVKPNFIQTTKHTNDTKNGDLITDNEPLITDKKPYGLFVGRLSPEKGCDVLIRAWHEFSDKWQMTSAESSPSTGGGQPATDDQPQLIIVGDGPERKSLEFLSAGNHQLSTVSFLGRKPKNEVLRLMRNAQFLVLPSLWYEGFPMTIVEAFHEGLAVLGPDGGGAGEIIEEKVTGLKFESGEQESLAVAMYWAFRNPARMKEFGFAARQVFDRKYSAGTNIKMLESIYQKAVNQ
jgi:glycosyltransferase involved in cell wall biosynthesis